MLYSSDLEDGIKVWHLPTVLGDVNVVDGHNGGAAALAFTPDGERLVSGGFDGSARLWDAASGQLRRTFQPHEQAVKAVGVSRDGRVLAAASPLMTLMRLLGQVNRKRGS